MYVGPFLASILSPPVFWSAQYFSENKAWWFCLGILDINCLDLPVVNRQDMDRKALRFVSLSISSPQLHPYLHRWTTMIQSNSWAALIQGLSLCFVISPSKPEHILLLSIAIVLLLAYYPLFWLYCMHIYVHLCSDTHQKIQPWSHCTVPGQQCPKQRAVMISQTLAASGWCWWDFMGFHALYITLGMYVCIHIYIYVCDLSVYMCICIYIYIHIHYKRHGRQERTVNGGQYL